MNIALHGMEHAAGVRYQPWRSTRGWSAPGTPGSDQVRRRPGGAVPHAATSRSRSRRGSTEWLAPRGLSFNEDKTRDRAPRPRDSTSWDSTSATTATREAADQAEQGRRSSGSAPRLRAEVRSLRGANADGRDRHDSTRSCGAGRPTTGRSCPRRSSRDDRLHLVVDDVQVGQTPTQRRRPASGSWSATSGRSTRPGRTVGSSATGTPAPTFGNCRGRRSVVT